MTVLENKFIRAASLALSLAVTSVAFATGVSPLEYYESHLANKGDGVYEHGDVLYLVTTARYDVRKTSTRRHAIAVATGKVSSLLKNWVVEQIVKRDGVPKPTNEEMKNAWQILENIAPGWMFPDLSMAVGMETIRDEAEKSGRYVIVMTGSKKEFEQKVLSEYKASCSASDIIKCLLGIGSRIESEDKTVTAQKMFGVPDLTSTCNGEKILEQEWKKLNQKIDSYLAKSDFAMQMRKDAVSIAAPRATTNRVEEINPQGTIKTTKLEIEIVEVVPRMHQLFLSGGNATNAPSERIASGERAVEYAFGNYQAADKAKVLKNALCENPGDGELWNLYGRVLNDGGEKEAAVICYRNALRIDPTAEYPMVNLAVVYSELGYKRLSVGLAMYARTRARQKWSVDMSEKLITGTP